MIRLATPEDVPAVMDLLEKFHEERGIGPLNSGKVEREVKALIDLADLFLVEAEGEIAGALGLTESVIWYNDDHVLNDRFFYVRPEHRGGVVGRMLLKAATLEAERRGLRVFVTIQNPERAQQRGRIAEVEGYAPFGHVTRLC